MTRDFNVNLLYAALDEKRELTCGRRFTAGASRNGTS
jgi:hypothetical protein